MLEFGHVVSLISIGLGFFFSLVSCRSSKLDQVVPRSLLRFHSLPIFHAYLWYWWSDWLYVFRCFVMAWWNFVCFVSIYVSLIIFSPKNIFFTKDQNQLSSPILQFFWWMIKSFHHQVPGLSYILTQSINQYNIIYWILLLPWTNSISRWINFLI